MAGSAYSEKKERNSVAMTVNKLDHGNPLWYGYEERIVHDDVNGECPVPWCGFLAGVESSEHINLDRVTNEPGFMNIFKRGQRLLEADLHMRQVLESEYRDEVAENADHHLENTHQLTLRVLKMLKNKADGRNEKIRALGRERDQLLSERSSLLSYIWDTFEQRAQLLESSGVENGVPLAIGIMENLRDQLESLRLGPQEDDNAPTNAASPDKGDSMRPEARRNVTLNDLHTTLLGMLLSGGDVAVKDLNTFIERYVSAVDSIVRRSVDLESDQECCVGCTEHRYDRPDLAVKRRT
jgi:hypothetical protein